MTDLSFTLTTNAEQNQYIYIKPRLCRFCTHWAKQEGEDKGYCLAPDMPAYIEGGIKEPVSGDFGCESLFEERQDQEGA